MVYRENESPMHRAAKVTVADWLRESSHGSDYGRIGSFTWRHNRGFPTYGVWVEYPIPEADIEVWDEIDGWGETERFQLKPPTFAECISMGYPPKFVADIALQHKGMLAGVVEIVHKNPIPKPKIEWLTRHKGIEVIEISAKWVMQQRKKPDVILHKRYSY